MGSCLSKDKPAYKGTTRPVGTQTSGNRAGAGNKQTQSNNGAGRKLGSASAGSATAAKSKSQSSPFSGQGRVLSDGDHPAPAASAGGEDAVNDPREAAARAAQARLDAAKSKNGTGKLGKKLEEERQKNKMTLLAESAADNKRTEPLIYD